MIDNTRLEKYIRGCLITWNTEPNVNGQLTNAALGVGGEVIEFSTSLGALDVSALDREEIISEAGDVLYYCSILLCKALESTTHKEEQEVIKEVASILQTAFTKGEAITFSMLYRMLGYVLETIKKHAFHGKPLDFTKLCDAICLIVVWLQSQIEPHDITIVEVMDYNFEKLSRRYPEGFKKLTETPVS